MNKKNFLLNCIAIFALGSTTALAQTLVQPTATLNEACVDTAPVGDGFGWNGTCSCDPNNQSGARYKNIAADKNTLAISSSEAPGGCIDSGSIFVFDVNSSGATQKAEIFPTDRTVRDRFPGVVSVAEKYIAANYNNKVTVYDSSTLTELTTQNGTLKYFDDSLLLLFDGVSLLVYSTRDWSLTQSIDIGAGRNAAGPRVVDLRFEYLKDSKTLVVSGVSLLSDLRDGFTIHDDYWWIDVYQSNSSGQFAITQSIEDPYLNNYTQDLKCCTQLDIQVNEDLLIAKRKIYVYNPSRHKSVVTTYKRDTNGMWQPLGNDLEVALYSGTGVRRDPNAPPNFFPATLVGNQLVSIPLEKSIIEFYTLNQSNEWNLSQQLPMPIQSDDFFASKVLSTSSDKIIAAHTFPRPADDASVIFEKNSNGVWQQTALFQDLYPAGFDITAENDFFFSQGSSIHILDFPNANPVDNCDYANADMFNGWGWDPVSRQSCAPRRPIPVNPDQCDYTDAQMFNGWGWNAVTATSCPPLENNQQNNCDYTNASGQGGWGWDPVLLQSCPPKTTTDTACEDRGDYPWGWNPVIRDSCRLD